MSTRFQPGEVRDAIVKYLSCRVNGGEVEEIHAAVCDSLGREVPASSVRSYLRLNTPSTFRRVSRGRYASGHRSPFGLSPQSASHARVPVFQGPNTRLFQMDCIAWLGSTEAHSIHAVVTDPPYGLIEYSDEEQAKLEQGKGGVWRIPPSFDGHARSPLPRFTVLRSRQLDELRVFFRSWSDALLPVLVPGANVIVASNPLLSHLVSHELAAAGLERRGEIVRLVMTMRGGDRPKNAHTEFDGVSVMPRSMWEPWLVFRKPLEGRVQDNLRRWGTGGFRRPSAARPFGDVISSNPTRPRERRIAAHPSLKPQAFLRQVVRAALPLGKGVVLDPFAGSGSTLAACEYLGYSGIGIERSEKYAAMAARAILPLSRFEADDQSLYTQD